MSFPALIPALRRLAALTARKVASSTVCMTDSLGITLAQINPTVGDIDGNLNIIRAARVDAATAGADLVIFGELVVCGYPPEDLVLKPFFQDKVEQAVGRLAEATADGNAAILIGAPWRIIWLTSFSLPSCWAGNT